MIEWQEKKFIDLSVEELYEVFKIRAEIFVLEQKIAYVDPDNKDQKAIHVIGRKENKIVAYARAFPPGEYYEGFSGFGRVAVDKKERGKGLGIALVEKTIEVCLKNFTNHDIKISAQEHLEKFYLERGFVCKNERYLEDGIPHCAMYYKEKEIKEKE